ADLKLSRLPFSRWEADAIFSLVSSDQRLSALDFDANRDALMNPDLKNYRYIHIATHAINDPLHPDLSALALSFFKSDGTAIPGLITAEEIYNMRLQASLVVLSGCGTALGKEIEGEGILGLSRAFLYAGTARVIASSWQLHDAATAELMGNFYRLL